MNDTFDMKAMGCKVYPILTDIPESRDDDRRLMFEIWMRDLDCSHPDQLIEKCTLWQFINAFLHGMVSNPETITRVRRKLQEKHEKLRGEKWESRHNMEGAVCEQLTFFDKW